MTKIGKRAETALKVLRAGGVFRKALEKNYHGGETFVMRLYTIDPEGRRCSMKGFGFKTWAELEDAKLLEKVYVRPSSTWAEEWKIREGV